MSIISEITTSFLKSAKYPIVQVDYGNFRYIFNQFNRSKKVLMESCLNQRSTSIAFSRQGKYQTSCFSASVRSRGILKSFQNITVQLSNRVKEEAVVPRCSVNRFSQKFAKSTGKQPCQSELGLYLLQDSNVQSAITSSYRR